MLITDNLRAFLKKRFTEVSMNSFAKKHHLTHALKHWVYGQSKSVNFKKVKLFRDMVYALEKNRYQFNKNENALIQSNFHFVSDKRSPIHGFDELTNLMLCPRTSLLYLGIMYDAVKGKKNKLQYEIWTKDEKANCEGSVLNIGGIAPCLPPPSILEEAIEIAKKIDKAPYFFNESETELRKDNYMNARVVKSKIIFRLCLLLSGNPDWTREGSPECSPDDIFRGSTLSKLMKRGGFCSDFGVKMGTDYTKQQNFINSVLFSLIESPGYRTFILDFVNLQIRRKQIYRHAIMSKKIRCDLIEEEFETLLEDEISSYPGEPQCYSIERSEDDQFTYLIKKANTNRAFNTLYLVTFEEDMIIVKNQMAQVKDTELKYSDLVKKVRKYDRDILCSNSFYSSEFNDSVSDTVLGLLMGELLPIDDIVGEVELSNKSSADEFWKLAKYRLSEYLFSTPSVKKIVKKRIEKVQQEKKLEAERDDFFNNKFATDRLTKKLAAFFKQRELVIVKYENGSRSDDFYDVAKHIWKSKDLLIPFIKNIPNCVSNKSRKFEYDANSLDKDDGDILWNFCKYIQDTKEWFTFERVDGIYTVQLSKSNHYVNFFTGLWAEEVSIYLIIKALNKFTANGNVKYKLFWNVCLRIFDSKKPWDMELDLVVQVKDNYYIFELNTGTVLQIDKWVDRTRLFRSDKSQFITCTANESLEPRIFQPYILFTLTALEEQFLEVLAKDFPGCRRV